MGQIKTYGFRRIMVLFQQNRRKCRSSFFKIIKTNKKTWFKENHDPISTIQMKLKAEISWYRNSILGTLRFAVVLSFFIHYSEHV